jgi:hypothetical protein
MASKKARKPQTEKQPKKITGLEATLLSFRARNGATSPLERSDFEEHVSPHIRKIVFARKKSKNGQKTLERMREVANENTRKSGVNSRRVLVR